VIAAALMLIPAVCAAARPSRAGSNLVADRAAVAQTYASFLDALANGNGRRACSLVTAAGRHKLITEFGPLTGGKRLPCTDIIVTVSGVLTPAIKQGLRTAVIKRVALKGKHASVRDADVTSRSGTLTGFLDPKSRTPTRFIKTANGWKLTA
jgi:hypothetical protein